MLQSEFHSGFEIAEFAATIIAPALEFIGQHLLAGEQTGNTIVVS